MLIVVKKLIYCVIHYNFRHNFVPFLVYHLTHYAPRSGAVLSVLAKNYPKTIQSYRFSL